MPATLAAAPKLRVAPPDAGVGGAVGAGPALEGPGADADRAEDDRLIAAALAGHDRAFGELVTIHQDRLRSTLARLTGSAEEAEDVAQEAFVQALLKLDTFQRTSRFYTWLYRIAFHLAVSKSRKRRPRVSLSVVQEAGGPEAVCEGPAPSHRAEADERRELLHAAIAALADDHRQVLVMREFDGFDYQEIADTLDVPIGTVRSRLFRARMQLKEKLAPALGDDADR
jgi:RNA polymerase sigma-70 factor (ECF subfamily)